METWMQYTNEYAVSNYGNVKNAKTGKLLKARTNSCGYLRVNIHGKELFIHRMVAQRFLGISNKKYINHLDGNKHNNCAYNLEYCTASENMLHYYRICITIFYPSFSHQFSPCLNKIGFCHLKWQI